MKVVQPSVELLKQEMWKTEADIFENKRWTIKLLKIIPYEK